MSRCPTCKRHNANALDEYFDEDIYVARDEDGDYFYIAESKKQYEEDGEYVCVRFREVDPLVSFLFTSIKDRENADAK